MPIHDWTRVDSGLFHEFHQSWSVRLKDSLNAGVLPNNFFALVEQRVNGPEPDVIAVETDPSPRSRGAGSAPAVLDPPRTKLVEYFDLDLMAYATKANRIAIRHRLGSVAAVIEIVSPGNKSSRNALRSFVEKAAEFLRAGVHLLILDLFPPSKRDPNGIHGALIEEFRDEPFHLPPDKPLTFVAYSAAENVTAFIEPLAVGDLLPAMPLFLTAETHVLVPLEATYQATWQATPAPIRERVAPAV